MTVLLIVVIVVVVLAVALLIAALPIVREYERVVVFRLGACRARGDPGWC